MKKDVMKLNFKLSQKIKDDMCECIMREIIWDNGIVYNKEKLNENKAKAYGRNDFSFIWKAPNELIEIMWVSWDKQPEWDDFKTILYSEILKNAEQYDTGFQSSYDKCCEIARSHMKTVPANFERYKNQVNDFIVNNLGMGDLDMPLVDTLITFTGGRWDAKNNFIVWGNVDGVNNSAYDVSYLFHEWFHAVETKHNLFCNDATHTILELADTYLYYKILGGTGTHSCHEHLDELRNKIKPYFNQFINNKKMTFLDFRENMIKKFS